MNGFGWAGIMISVAAFGLGSASLARAVGGPALEPPAVRIVGSPSVVFDAARDGCDGNDVPDAPLRAFRAADDTIRAFGLHYTNHPLQGPSFDRLTIACHAALPSHGNDDPAAYDDKSWIAATWTRDGALVDALVHHEYQADSHQGRCRFASYMECWFNTVLAVHSTNGGVDFTSASPRVVASFPFRQEAEQGRHRGFFNPSNIFGDGRFAYVLASTTGWEGQPFGVCLFRTETPDESGSWRAWDGTAFSIRFRDPYGVAEPLPKPCLPLGPFPAPVGSVVRLRDAGVWLAVFQAAADGAAFPQSGFYAAGSRDLLHWSEPRLIMAGVTNYEDPCRSGGRMIAYPSLIDPGAVGRNFDDVGRSASLFYAAMKVEGCTITADRVLMRQPVTVTVLP